MGEMKCIYTPRSLTDVFICYNHTMCNTAVKPPSISSNSYDYGSFFSFDIISGLLQFLTTYTLVFMLIQFRCAAAVMLVVNENLKCIVHKYRHIRFMRRNTRRVAFNIYMYIFIKPLDAYLFSQ